ncbi:hypothetical protein ATG66_2146 [Vibrio sp. ES.051]|uniref:outer membrane protein n=1 Tax=Vibrio sp. ES.051 TaxID=1761909 RepID=UPI000BF4F9E9|nr:hypothetical protein [Vibrio sp. ES.051]PFG55827.1 hypothetical protein ATG66_2146 [Vibrio sp. ES.051]
MDNKFRWLVGSLLVSLAANAHANIAITPFVGYAGGGQVEDENGNAYDFDPAINYALSIEAPFEIGKIGVFYSNQSTGLEQLSNSANIHYLQFQSSIYYPIQQGWQAYIGVGVGGSYTDVNWVDNKYGFSASAFTGLEYEFSKNVALTAQLRWLGTVVDNDTSGACTLPSDGSSCIIKFDTDWMNQFQSNIGFSFRF